MTFQTITLWNRTFPKHLHQLHVLQQSWRFCMEKMIKCFSSDKFRHLYSEVKVQVRVDSYYKWHSNLWTISETLIKVECDKLWILISPLRMIWSGSTADSHQRSHNQLETALDGKNGFLKSSWIKVNLVEFRLCNWLNLQLMNLVELHCGSQA